MKAEELFARLNQVDDLPTLPVVIEKLRVSMKDPQSDAARFATIVEDDPAISARILRVINSALYAGTEPIASMQLAIARLGIHALSNIAMSTAVFAAFNGKYKTDFDREGLWQHSICSGIAAAILREHVGSGIAASLDREFIHLAGLLHDIGKIIFDRYFHAELMEALLMAREANSTLSMTEVAVLGASHAQVGAWLGEEWRLSPELLDVIRWHHDPERASDESRDLVRLCHLANGICNQEGLGASGDAAPSIIPETWEALGIPTDEKEDILTRIRQEAEGSEVLRALLGG